MKKMKEEKIEHFVTLAKSYTHKYEESLKSSEDYESVMTYKIGQAGYAYLIDKDDKILMHPNPDLLGKEIPETLPQVLKKNLHAVRSGNDAEVFIYTYHGQDKLNYMYLAPNETVLVITGPLKDRYE